MNAKPTPEGWCPGALRPFGSADGLIVRLRLSCSELSPTLAAAIADWSEAFGNGRIDLSGRANLQLRGVSSATLPPLHEALAERGLLDAHAEAEAVRNVVVSPFAGIAGTLDLRPIAKALEAALATRSGLWRLPGKFGFALDAGPYPLGDVGVDVAFEALDAGSFQVRLAGADRVLGTVAAPDVVPVAVALANAFLALEPAARRMREAVDRCGIDAIAASAGLTVRGPSEPRTARPLADVLGVHESFVGAALPFGRIEAGELRALARAAALAGATLRLTPWRVILAVGAPHPPQGGRQSLLADAGLVLDARDPRLRIAACSGAPACHRATLDTRALAADLSRLVAPGAGLALHVSGCAKGCAHPSAAPLTVIGDGETFALVRDGRAGDAPARSGLDREALRAALEDAL